MPASASVTTSPDLEGSARTARFDAQKVLWRETKRSRLAFCGRIVASSSDGVSVLVSRASDGTTAGLSGLQTCGSVWACPVCAEKINAVRQRELARGIEAWLRQGERIEGPRCRRVCTHSTCSKLRRSGKAGGAVVFGTLTLQHHKGHRLEELWDAITPAWNRATSGAGVAWNGGKNEPGDRQRFGIAGSVRVVEVKHGANGWHPHVHFLLFLDRELDDQELDQLRARIFGRWAKELGKHGLKSLEFDRDGHAVGADLRRVTDSAYMADYFAKHGYRPRRSTAAEGAAYEVTGSHSKRAGKGGRTPFELLADVVAVGDADALDLWHEWEEVSAGRRQLNWTRGLRKLLELEVELTDQEIVDDELEGEPVWTFTRDEWVAGRWYERKAELLEAAEDGTLARVVSEWIGSRFSRPATAGPPDRP